MRTHLSGHCKWREERPARAGQVAGPCPAGRHRGDLEAGSPRTVPQALGRAGRRAGQAQGRLTEPERSHRHHPRSRSPGVQPVRLAGRVRARADPRTYPGGPVSCTGAGPRRWAPQGLTGHGRGHRHGGGNPVPRGPPERQRHWREAAYFQEHAVQLPAASGRRDRHLPEECSEARSAPPQSCRRPSRLPNGWPSSRCAWR